MRRFQALSLIYGALLCLGQSPEGADVAEPAPSRPVTPTDLELLVRNISRLGSRLLPALFSDWYSRRSIEAAYYATDSERLFSISDAQVRARIYELEADCTALTLYSTPAPVATSYEWWLSLFGGLIFAISVFVGGRRREKTSVRPPRHRAAY